VPGTDVAVQDAVGLTTSASGSRVVLGLTGPPGAGKSTLAEAIVQHARGQMGEHWAAYLPMDGYHLSNAQLRRLGLEDRKGAPGTFDIDGYAAMLARLVADAGSDIYVPEYDRGLHEPIAARLMVPGAARLIVTEGNYLSLDDPAWRGTRRFIDHLWYVDASDSLREERLVARQISGGRSGKAARDWVAFNDRPNAELVKRSRGNTDRTITPVLA
jgi:pantothenate kinase